MKVISVLSYLKLKGLKIKFLNCYSDTNYMHVYTSYAPRRYFIVALHRYLELLKYCTIQLQSIIQFKLNSQRNER